ncbi:hypothetical protein JDV02_008686 [Purpureocillium takamizusanense]|uniref:Uncharacterized protein n=1 Tax=Purpureocillium takamizusanense TaxID=2060973 RepID=A0A9Q8VEP6_9HYPO|nr:uncharacterized protein JDV02_008686 [Purpureocillium takamizusanense]UNI22833.1 hypothetical protein JDV02_008686 [Purpureocillium takamizusanense]
MGVLSNNKEKRPVKVRVEKRVWQERQYHPDGRYYILDHNPPPPRNVNKSEVQKNLNTCKPKPDLTVKAWKINEESWEQWEPVFHHVAVKFRVDHGGKEKLEEHMAAKREYDGYQHWRCKMFRSACTGTLKIGFSVDFAARTFGILYVLFMTDGLPARLATRTSIAHSGTTGCSFWTELSPSDCKVVPCCADLCEDVPRQGDISIYEHGLRIRQLKRDQAKDKAESEREQCTIRRSLGCKIRGLEKQKEALEEQVDKLVQRNRALEAAAGKSRKSGLGNKRGREDSGFGGMEDEETRGVKDEESSDDDMPLVPKRRRLA